MCHCCERWCLCLATELVTLWLPKPSGLRVLTLVQSHSQQNCGQGCVSGSTGITVHWPLLGSTWALDPCNDHTDYRTLRSVLSYASTFRPAFLLPSNMIKARLVWHPTETSQGYKKKLPLLLCNSLLATSQQLEGQTLAMQASMGSVPLLLPPTQKGAGVPTGLNSFQNPLTSTQREKESLTHLYCLLKFHFVFFLRRKKLIFILAHLKIL